MASKTKKTKTVKTKPGPKPRGGNVGLEEKIDFVEHVIQGGNISEWATKHDRARSTAHRLLDDVEVRQFIEAAERGQGQRFAAVVEKAYMVAMDPDHIHWAAAANFLAKVHGKYKAEKHSVEIVDRVAYVEPGVLRERSLAQYPELRPN